MARLTFLTLLSVTFALVLTVSYTSEANSIGEAFLENGIDLEEADGWPLLTEADSEDPELSKTSIEEVDENEVAPEVAKKLADRAAELRQAYGSFRVKRS